MAKQRPTSRSCLTSVISLGLILVIGWAGLKFFYPSLTPAGLLYIAQTTFQFSNRQVLGPVIPMSRGGDGLEPDLLALTMSLGSSLQTYRATYTNQSDGLRRVQWEVELGQDSNIASRFQAISDAESVYLIADDRLISLDRVDGTVRWQANLSDQLPIRCQTCLAVLEDRVIVLSADRVLHGLNRADGRLEWQVRLTSGRASGYGIFMTAAGHLAVMDEVAEADIHPAGALYLFEPQTGREVGRLMPVCGNPAERQAGVDLSTPLFFNERMDTVTFIIPGPAFDYCFQQWDLAQGQLLVGHKISSDLLDVGSMTRLENNLEGSTALLVEPTILILPGGERLLALDLSNGHIAPLAETPGYTVSPLLAREGTLIALAERTRGSTRHELWGLDVTSGEQRWSYPVPNDRFFRAEGLAGRGDWAFQLTPAGLVIVQISEIEETFFGYRYQIYYEVLDPQTGQLLTQIDSLAEDGFWTGTAWSADFAYLTLRDLYRLDLASGQGQVVWPPQLLWPGRSSP